MLLNLEKMYVEFLSVFSGGGYRGYELNKQAIDDKL
jgi:hypothetical protein